MNLPDFERIQTEAELLRAARAVYQGIRPAELNFAAAIITISELERSHPSPKFIDQIEQQAEQQLLQLGLLNSGEIVPSPFVMAAYAAGWRYRAGVFRKLERPAAAATPEGQQVLF